MPMRRVKSGRRRATNTRRRTHEARVTREADGELQTTALGIDEGRIAAIYAVRNPDKLKHLH